MQMALFTAGFDPDGSRGAELALPDRNPSLDRLDSGPAGGKSLGPMGSGSRDDHRDITHGERANPVAEKHLRVRMGSGEVLCDPGHLLFRHRAVGLVFKPMHSMTLVFVSY